MKAKVDRQAPRITEQRSASGECDLSDEVF